MFIMEFMISLLIIFLILTPVVNSSILDESNYCSLCQCDEDYSVRCSNIQDSKLIIRKLHNDIRILEIRNITQVIIDSQAILIKIQEEFHSYFTNISVLSFKENAFDIVNPQSKFHLQLNESKLISFDSHSITGKKNGKFFLNIINVEQIKIKPEAFDIITKIHLEKANKVILSPLAFKPNILSEVADIEICLKDITTLTKLPTNLFSSAKNITFSNCNIKDMESKSFSGIMMESVQFINSTIDRFHSNAFPESSLINQLEFVNCNFSSISENSIRSAISSLQINKCSIESLSKSGLNCQVAQVAFRDNNFKTLVNHSISIQSWNSFIIEGNTIGFMDSGALSGIKNPGLDVNISFIFERNEFVYANRDALRLNLPQQTKYNVDANKFQKECDCDIDVWLTYLSGENLINLMNTSQCMLPNFMQKCFGQNYTNIQYYIDKVCSTESDFDITSCGTSHIWSIVEEKIKISTNKGILLLILLFAVAFSLLVSIYTLIRWIIYTIQMKIRSRNQDEWQFAQIENQTLSTPTPSENIYEEIMPLTKDELSSSSETNTENGKDNTTTVSIETNSQQNKEENKDDKRHSTLFKSEILPKITFYDEMIDILQDKLEDPDYYATVADNQSSLLYQDPFDIAEAKQEENNDKKVDSDDK